MAGRPQQITVSLTADQAAQLDEIMQITKEDTTQTVRKALALYYEKIMNDENAREIAQINAMLDVQ